MEDPPRDIDPGETFPETSPETFPIPSIIDMSWKPPGIKYVPVPYYMRDRERDEIAGRDRTDPPRTTLPRLEENQRAQVSTNESDSGASFPIPSITGIDPDPCDDPYGPPGQPGERLYTVLITKLNRAEAKHLRRQIRNQGLGAFSDIQWALKDFVRIPRAYRRGQLGDSYVCRGNREGVDSALRQERLKHRPDRRTVMIVEQDGGVLSIKELIPIHPQTRTTAVLKIFEMFEV